MACQLPRSLTGATPSPCRWVGPMRQGGCSCPDALIIWMLSIAPVLRFRLRSEGSVALFSEQGLTLDLAHRAEQVEFAAGNDTWRLSDADLSTRGTLSALSLGLDSGVSSSLLPDFALTAEGQLTGSALSVNQAQAETAGGELVAALVMDCPQGLNSAPIMSCEADPLALLERELPVSLATW